MGFTSNWNANIHFWFLKVIRASYCWNAGTQKEEARGLSSRPASAPWAIWGQPGCMRLYLNNNSLKKHNTTQHNRGLEDGLAGKGACHPKTPKDKAWQPESEHSNKIQIILSNFSVLKCIRKNCVCIYNPSIWEMKASGSRFIILSYTMSLMLACATWNCLYLKKEEKKKKLHYSLQSQLDWDGWLRQEDPKYKAWLGNT